MEELKKDLKKKNFTAGEYIIASFDVFKKVLVENKVLVTFYVLFCTLVISEKNRFEFKIQNVYSGIFDKLPKKNNENFILVFIAILIFTFISKIIIRKLQNKLAVEIDGENNFMNIKKIIFKVVIYYIIYEIPSALFDILSASETSKIIGGVFGILFTIVIFTLFLYFDTIFFCRNKNLMESLNESIYITKGNRIRLLFPYILISLLGIAVSLPLMEIGGSFIGSYEPMYEIGGIISSITSIYIMILKTIIYFNLETRETKEEKYKKIEELREKYLSEDEKN